MFWVFVYICIMNFKIGDKVRGKGSQSGINLTGEYGTICDMHKDSILIEWDRSIYDISGGTDHGHSCDGKAKDGHGWNIYLGADILDLAAIAPLPFVGFKIGDRVRGKGIQDGVDFSEQYGTIYTDDLHKNLAVEWDRSIYDISSGIKCGHNCDGKTKDGYGWFISKDNLELISGSAPATTAFFNTPLKETEVGFGTVNIPSYDGPPPAFFTQPIVYAPSKAIWADTMSSGPAPSPYLHKEPSYVGKIQQFNAILHNKQLDEFLILNL